MSELKIVALALASAGLVAVPAQQLAARLVLRPRRRPVRHLAWLVWFVLGTSFAMVLLGLWWFWLLGAADWPAFVIGLLIGLMGGTTSACLLPRVYVFQSYRTKVALEHLLVAFRLVWMGRDRSAARHWQQSVTLIDGDLRRDWREMTQPSRRPRTIPAGARLPLREHLQMWYARIWLIGPLGRITRNACRRLSTHILRPCSNWLWRTLVVVPCLWLWRQIRDFVSPNHWPARRIVKWTFPFIIWPLLRLIFAIEPLWLWLGMAFSQLLRTGALVLAITTVVGFLQLLSAYDSFRRKRDEKYTVSLKDWGKRLLVAGLAGLGVWALTMFVLTKLPWGEWLMKTANVWASALTFVLWAVLISQWHGNPLADAGLLDERGFLVVNKIMASREFYWPVVNRAWGFWFPILKLLAGIEPDVPWYAYLFLLNPFVKKGIIQGQLGIKDPPDGTGGAQSDDFRDWILINASGPFGMGYRNLSKWSIQKLSPAEDAIPTSWHYSFDVAYVELQVVSMGEKDISHRLPCRVRGNRFKIGDPVTHQVRVVHDEEAFLLAWFLIVDAAGDIKTGKKAVETVEYRQPAYERARQQQQAQRRVFDF